MASSQVSSSRAPGPRIILAHDRHGDIVELESPDPATTQRKGPRRAEPQRSITR